MLKGVIKFNCKLNIKLKTIKFKGGEMIPSLESVDHRKKEIIETLWPLAVTATPNKVEFARDVCGELGIEYSAYQRRVFADGERFFQMEGNLRDREVFIITSTEQPDSNLVDLLLLADTVKSSCAASRVTVIFTYFGWARSDRKDAPRKSLSVATIAKLIKAMDVDRIMILDPHFSQIQAIFYGLNIKCDLLFGSTILAGYIKQRINLEKFGVSSLDGGGQKIVKDYSERLSLPYYLTFKERFETDQTKIVGGNGDKIEIEGVLGADDLTSTLGSLLHAAKNYKQHGVKLFYGAVTHFVATKKNVRALLKVLDNPLIDGLFVTDSVSFPDKARQHPKLFIVPLKELIAYVIFNTYYRQSISEIFKK